MQYAVLGKLTARPKINGKRVKVRKKAHIIRDGRSICNAENAYKTQPPYTPVERPEPSQVCRNCLGLDGRTRPEHPVQPESRKPDSDLPDELRQSVSEVSRAARADALERVELGEGEYAEPSLAVLMGERMADETDTSTETPF